MNGLLRNHHGLSVIIASIVGVVLLAIIGLLILQANLSKTSSTTPAKTPLPSSSPGVKKSPANTASPTPLPTPATPTPLPVVNSFDIKELGFKMPIAQGQWKYVYRANNAGGAKGQAEFYNGCPVGIITRYDNTPPATSGSTTKKVGKFYLQLVTNINPADTACLNRADELKAGLNAATAS